MRLSALLAAVTALIGPASMAQPSAKPTGLAAGFSPGEIKTSDGLTRRYALFVPAQFDRAKRWPLVVFLHGSGESGDDGVRQTRVGLGPFLTKHRDRVPFLALFPQAKGWFRGGEAKAVLEEIAAVEREYPVDPERIYLTGISMGGFGTWEISMLRPDLFAAIVPICGGGPVEGAANIARMPTWAFHGAKDDRVPVDLSRKLVDALKTAGAQPKYTEYPNGNHFIWDQAYATKGLFGWLLSQRRQGVPRAIRVALDRGWCPVPTRVWWLRIDAADPRKTRLLVEAEVASINEVRLKSDGLIAATIVDEQCGPDVTEPLRVVWNGQVVYNGVWRPEVALKLSPAAPTTTAAPATETQPASRPAR